MNGHQIGRIVLSHYRRRKAAQIRRIRRGLKVVGRARAAETKKQLAESWL
jgi:hypothetical protein